MGSFCALMPASLPLLLLLLDAGTIGVPSPASAPAPARVISVDNRILGAQPGDTLILEIGTDTIVAEIQRDWMRSRTVELRRAATHLKGFIGEQGSDLTLEPEQITGTIGQRPVSLAVQRSAGALDVEGVFGDRAIALRLAPDTINGDVGPCRYALRRRGGDYLGKVDCGGKPERVRLQLPVTLIGRDDAELAALMTALLAR
jgi:hypothetical protein